MLNSSTESPAQMGTRPLCGRAALKIQGEIAFRPSPQGGPQGDRIREKLRGREQKRQALSVAGWEGIPSRVGNLIHINHPNSIPVKERSEYTE